MKKKVGRILGSVLELEESLEQSKQLFWAIRVFLSSKEKCFSTVVAATTSIYALRKWFFPLEADLCEHVFHLKFV